MRCLFSVSQGETLMSINGDALEYSILRAPIEEIWIGTGRFVVHVVRADAHVVRRKRHDFFRFLERQRTQEHRIQDAEDRGVRANTKCKCDDNDGGKGWLLCQRAQRIANILSHGAGIIPSVRR